MPQYSFEADDLNDTNDIQKKLRENVYPTMNQLLGDTTLMSHTVTGIGLERIGLPDGYCLATDPDHPVTDSSCFSG